ncbi:predicted protein [Clavispora lusitaniae ATCC 42720]|uniref:Uncharacterized protein n=1 Tax=Clavispora lusitaniae (strain ATCC 42720) TaxID=306902 RepID=C4YAN6_CLAL4|nr:uncharacterized protein CLUG_05264 [Clavispora lusitaniae ATCC 42720]EEQ41135.1 predicted protein [Clavispora lusitaniae ATCC 42720]
MYFPERWVLHNSSGASGRNFLLLLCFRFAGPAPFPFFRLFWNDAVSIFSLRKILFHFFVLQLMLSKVIRHMSFTVLICFVVSARFIRPAFDVFSSFIVSTVRIINLRRCPLVRKSVWFLIFVVRAESSFPSTFSRFIVAFQCQRLFSAWPSVA